MRNELETIRYLGLKEPEASRYGHTLYRLHLVVEPCLARHARVSVMSRKLADEGRDMDAPPIRGDDGSRSFDLEDSARTAIANEISQVCLKTQM